MQSQHYESTNSYKKFQLLNKQTQKLVRKIQNLNYDSNTMPRSPSNNSKIEDSLDNLSNTKLRQESLEKHRIQLIQTKQKFVSLLEKLQSSETREVSLNELKKLIEKNREPQHLRIYLSIMKSLRPNSNSTTKEHEILVLSILTQVFRQNLIDSIDKQPSVMKTCFKVVEILLGFFADSSNSVQQACARIILDINTHCLSSVNCEKEQKVNLLFTPLISILKNGVDKASQSTSTVCINQLVRHWVANGQKQYLDLVSRQIFLVLMKLNSQYHNILMTTLFMIDHKGLAFFENKLPNFISKILGIINSTKEQHQTNSFNSFMCKVNVCKIVEKIAIFLTAEEKNQLVDLNVYGSLEKAARNKIIQVQMSATRALKAWRGEPVQQERMNSVKGKPLGNLEEMRNQRKRERSSSKQDRVKNENELNYLKEDLEKMVKGGWGANNRAKHYVKRGTGVGGGHYGEFESSSTPPKNNSKSHKEHLEELRQVIKKGSRQNKNYDKFQQVKGLQKLEKFAPTNSDNNINQGNTNKFSKQSQNNNEHRDMGRDRPQQIFSNKQKKVLNENSGDQFVVEEDQGEQMVAFQRKKQSNQTDIKERRPLPSPSNNSNATNSFYIGTQEAKELLDHENSLIAEFKNSPKEIDFYSESKNAESSNKQSQQSKQIKPSQQTSSYVPTPLPDIKDFKKKSPDSKQASKRDRLVQGQGQRRNSDKATVGQQIKSTSPESNPPIAQKLPSTKQQLSNTTEDRRRQLRSKRISQFAPMISQDQLQDLMMENNLSEVSENLDNILNDSDFNLAEQSLGKSHTPLMENQFQRSLNANSAVQNNDSIEVKLENSQNDHGRMEDSLNFTESKGSRYKESAFAKNQNYEIPSRKMKNETQSQQHQQFTLNPNHNHSQSKKFQSIYEGTIVADEVQEEVEEDLVSSYFEESRPKDAMLPLRTQIQKPSVQSHNQELQSQSRSKNFQQLIQNPPNTQKHLDKRSVIKGQTSHHNSEIKQSHISEIEPLQDEKSSITEDWIRILNLVENDEVNEAYEKAFKLDDPIYLIRLLIITKTPISALTAQNCSKLWQKFLDVYKHSFISILTIQLFSEANELNMIKSSLTIEEMQELLLSLYQISGTSKGKLSFNAALLYNSIDENMKPKQK